MHLRRIFFPQRLPRLQLPVADVLVVVVPTLLLSFSTEFLWVIETAGMGILRFRCECTTDFLFEFRVNGMAWYDIGGWIH
jgi:hypothetical protein